MSERINSLQWGTREQNQCHAVAQSTETLCFSQSKLEYPVSQESPWIRVLGYGTGCSLISLRKQNFQDLKHLNLDRLI